MTELSRKTIKAMDKVIDSVQDYIELSKQNNDHEMFNQLQFLLRQIRELKSEINKIESSENKIDIV